MSQAPPFVGPDALVHPHPLLSASDPVLARLSAEAERIDADGVTSGDVEAVAAAGLLAPWASAELGGQSAPEPVVRELTERLSGASGSLWFVTAQHRSPAEVAQRTDNASLRERWAAPLASGAALGAVAFAHLRRPGPPQVLATPDGDGWRVDGRLDWVTSWGLADVLLLMAETADGDVVQSLLPAVSRPGLVATGRLQLAAMGGTSTEGMVLDAVHVEHDEVAAVLPKVEWLARDAERTANASPASFGLARAAVEALATSSALRGSAAGEELAESLRARLVTTRRRAYMLIDEVPAGELLAERLELRAAALDLSVTAATALVAVQAGRAMALSSPAQRWAREALFHLVQAQTAAVREQLLSGWRRDRADR